MTSDFRSRLKGGETLLGTIVSLPSPACAELFAGVGYDWLFIDAEHGAISLADIGAIVPAVAGRAACVVRIPGVDETAVKRVLDLGADGIIVPRVDTAAQAAEMVAAARYPPEGRRGVGLARAHGYGLRFDEYLDTANRTVAVIAQAESAEAVENIESIAAVSGIDAVLIGPYDLSASLGRMGEVDHPDVVRAIDRIAEVCRTAGVPLGIFGVTAKAVSPYMARGFTLVVAGVDTLYLAAGARDLLAELRRA